MRAGWEDPPKTQVIVLENAVTADHKRRAKDIKMLQGKKINSDL